MSPHTHVTPIFSFSVLVTFLKKIIITIKITHLKAHHKHGQQLYVRGALFSILTISSFYFLSEEIVNSIAIFYNFSQSKILLSIKSLGNFERER